MSAIPNDVDRTFRDFNVEGAAAQRHNRRGVHAINGHIVQNQRHFADTRIHPHRAAHGTRQGVCSFLTDHQPGRAPVQRRALCLIPFRLCKGLGDLHLAHQFPRVRHAAGTAQQHAYHSRQQHCCHLPDFHLPVHLSRSPFIFLIPSGFSPRLWKSVSPGGCLSPAR